MRPVAMQGRSGNEPARRVEQAECRWVETRAALGRLTKSLACSRCNDILRKPVNLGGCEHVFCLSCVGDCIGAECPVCHTPARVQDMKVTRQLESIIALCAKLQSLQCRDFVGSGEDLPVSGEVTCDKGNRKNPVKMWFSPRSRKVRFVLDRRPDKPKPAAADEDSKSALLASMYDFIPSPPHAEPFKEAKKRQKRLRKKALADANQQWGLARGNVKNLSDSATKVKLVSFCSQDLIIPSPDPKSLSRDVSAIGRDQSEVQRGASVTTFEILTENSSSDRSSAVVEENVTCKEGIRSEGERTPFKRRRPQMDSPGSLLKRPRRKEQAISGNAVNSDIFPKQPHEDAIGKGVACVTSSPSVSSASTFSALRCSEDIQCASQQTSLEASPPAQKEPEQIVPVSKKASTNLLTKRNHKGETSLHVASMEGNLSAVELLLKSGADPNVKDYAGWTPLHEACSHGHEEVVKLLLQHGALLNAAGYQNELPLHDAVKNGHASIATLLLRHGASREAVNIFGQRALDYAETEKMKSLLMLPMKNDSSTVAHCSEDLRLFLLLGPEKQANVSRPREGPLVLLGSGLDPAQQRLLVKSAAALKATVCTEFNSTVTHVVVPGSHLRSTMKCMLAILNGCWIVTLKWAELCLQMETRETEEKHEVNGAPQRGRLNKEQLLPKLFDGCYFYFGGTFKEHDKNDLKELAKAGGGQIVLRKPKSDNDVTQTVNTVAYHARSNSDQEFCTHYIVYDGSTGYRPVKIRQGKVWEVPSKWLIDCVMSFQLLPVE